MALKATGETDEWTVIDRFEDSVGWMAHPSETMQRASHAVVADGDVWVIDPVDVEGLDDLLAEYGTVAGVVILLDRHKRDCAAVANRHDVSVWIPSFMTDVADEIDASIERFDNALGDSGFRLQEVVNNSFWQEGALYNEKSGVLIVPESVGTSEFFRTGNRVLGVHPLRRLTPPTELAKLEPERIHVGHGKGVHEDAPRALRKAVAGSRIRTPQLYAKNVKKLLFG